MSSKLFGKNSIELFWSLLLGGVEAFSPKLVWTRERMDTQLQAIPALLSHKPTLHTHHSEKHCDHCHKRSNALTAYGTAQVCGFHNVSRLHRFQHYPTRKLIPCVGQSKRMSRTCAYLLDWGESKDQLGWTDVLHWVFGFAETEHTVWVISHAVEVAFSCEQMSMARATSNFLDEDIIATEFRHF